MSKKKNSISYIKPQEPKFLRELKAQAGFKEGPNIDTKVQSLIYKQKAQIMYRYIIIYNEQ